MTCGNRLLSSWNRLGYLWRYLYHADLLESLPLLVLHCVGQDRLWLPYIFLSVDIATEFGGKHVDATSGFNVHPPSEFEI